MRTCLVVLLLVSTVCRSQEWQGEIMIGGANYNGDLSQKGFILKTIRPVVNINAKYEFYYLVLRAGISYTQLVGDDANNKDPFLKYRNLSFKTNLIEASFIAELNLFEPDIFFAYPYIFAGVGAYHFNPFSDDKEGNKTFLHPLHTEGQGLVPDRENYSLTQFCMPMGAGWKFRVNPKFDIVYEFGYRLCFTDYLDDVSKTYAENNLLVAKVGPKALEMAVKAIPIPGTGYFPSEGDQRGNPKIKDGYYFSGIKLVYHMGKDRR